MIAELLSLALLASGEAAAEENDLAYGFRLRREPTLAVQIELTLTGGGEGGSTFVVEASWGGVDAGGKDIENVQARDAQGNALEVERLADHRWRVRHEPAAELHVTYEIRANENQLEPDPSVSRRPILNAGLFHTVGHLGLLRVEGRPLDEPLDVSLAWEGFEERGWSVMTSFGPGGGERVVHTTLGELLGSLYVAGVLDVHEHDLAGYPVFVTFAGDGWRLDRDELATVAAEIVGAERAFFDDHERDFYWVSLIPVGRPGGSTSSLGGTGLHNCFALLLHPEVPFELGGESGQRILFLLAHETFHEWNGRIIRREEPEQSVYWFSEGFTDFYARRLLKRSGWIDTAAYAAHLDRRLSALYLSPVRTEPNERIVTEFWRSRDYKDLPYRRGDLVALLVDRAIRDASRGERSLDDLMRELVAAGREGALVSTGSLLARIAEHAGEPTAERIRAIVVEGELPELSADLLAPCLELGFEEQPVFDLGFDFEGSMRAKRVRGLRAGSRAHAAGLRNGQRLVGWSVHHGQTDRPVTLTIEEDGAAREIAYEPHGEMLEVPVFSVVGGEADCVDL